MNVQLHGLKMDLNKKGYGMYKTEQELAGIRKLKKELTEELWYLEILERGGVIGKECDIYTDQLDEFKRIKKKYTDLTYNEYWSNQQNWSLSSLYPERYKNQQEFFEQYFIPLLDQTQYVCDLASANGEWSMKVAPYVNAIDGFEYASGMVEFANKEAEKKGILNARFYQADACALQFDKLYDNFMMMGLLTCIFDDSDALNIVRKVYQAIRKGGHLIVKDSMNVAGEDVIYLYNFLSRYDAIYRSKEQYYKLFEQAGFVMERDTVFHEVDKAGLAFESVGVIWKKE